MTALIVTGTDMNELANRGRVFGGVSADMWVGAYGVGYGMSGVPEFPGVTVHRIGFGFGTQGFSIGGSGSEAAGQDNTPTVDDYLEDAKQYK